MHEDRAESSVVCIGVVAENIVVHGEAVAKSAVCAAGTEQRMW